MRKLHILALAFWVGIAAPVQAADHPRIRAIAFDALTIFDTSPLWVEVEKQFPAEGKDLAALWRTRLFEYQWLRAAGDHYENFERVAEDALVFAVKSRKLELSPEKRKAILARLLQLKAYPDVKPALQSLKAGGFRLVLLSNMTPAMLEAGIQNSDLKGLFVESLSTDRLRTYKPDPKAYQLGVDALHLKREEILFVPFASWDLSGARWFGYPTFWVNRSGAPLEELDAASQVSGKDLSDLCRYIGTHCPIR
jgi:2-haloacid dehalogenase